jgi:recombination protein RecA
MEELKDLIKKVNDEVKNTLIFGASTTQRADPLKEGLSSGSYKLNLALSGNILVGFAMGRIVEIYGPEQSGKSTLTFHILAEAQKRGLSTLYIDLENALDLQYASKILDLKKLGIAQPDFAEQTLSLVETSLKNGFKVIAVDSVAALVPKAELDGEAGEAHIGKVARLMSQAMRRTSGLIRKEKALVVFVNQIRMKIGVMFGNPETTTGGNALKFYASYRIDIRAPRGGAESEKTLDGDTEETGIKVKIKVVKNKLYPPYRKTILSIKYGEGIDKVEEVADMAYEDVAPKVGLKWKTAGGAALTKKKCEERLREGKMNIKEVEAYVRKKYITSK